MSDTIILVVDADGEVIDTATACETGKTAIQELIALGDIAPYGTYESPTKKTFPAVTMTPATFEEYKAVVAAFNELADSVAE